MEHHFDVSLAIKYGMVEAVIINHFQYWIEANRANDRNFHDGRYWTFNSMKAFSEIFPYLSESKIRNALKRLQDEGIIVTGNYNKLAYDRTLWYAFSDFGESILQNYKMDLEETKNGRINFNGPIPDNNPYNNPYNNTDNIVCVQTTRKPKKPKSESRFSAPTVEEVRQYCLERKNGVDPERFCDYYQSNGWKVGKSSMKDWKAAVRTWERRDGYGHPTGQGVGKDQNGAGAYDLSDIGTTI